jgi:hypothetical protein
MLLSATCRLLRPLVRLLMRNGITFPVLADSVRGLFIDIAATELLVEPKARTDSRISLLTGVHRKEIRRLRTSSRGDAGTPRVVTPRVVTFASQIIARWLGSPEYQDGAGAARPLPRSKGAGGSVSFDDLIASVTTDVRPRAVLDDWLSQGLVSLDDQDRVHLETTAYIPRPGGREQLFYFGRNLHDHIAAGAANIGAAGPAPFVDRSLHYDRLPLAAALRLETFARAAAARALAETNRLALELAEQADQASPPPASRRVNFGVYIYTADENPPPADDERSPPADDGRSPPVDAAGPPPADAAGPPPADAAGPPPADAAGPRPAAE